MTLDPELLGILACPACRGSLDPLTMCDPSSDDPTREPQGLACTHCNLVYPIRDEIPVMLAEEAVARREWDAGKRESSKTP